MQSTTLLALASLLIGSTAATWCNFYYDAGCTQDANGGTSFDCANTGEFGSGGGFFQCHATYANDGTCRVDRVDGGGNILNEQTVSVANDHGKTSCINSGGAGPYYKLYFYKN